MSDDTQGCPFCALLADGSRRLICGWDEAVAFEPLDPVVPGHVLVVPREHVADASVRPVLTGKVMSYAAALAREVWPCNIITSCGAVATQSVFHLHVHVVPRREGDGLLLPWQALGLSAAVEQARGIAAAVESQNAEALTEWQRDPGRHADASHCLACRVAQALTDGPLDGGEQS